MTLAPRSFSRPVSRPAAPRPVLLPSAALPVVLLRRGARAFVNTEGGDLVWTLPEVVGPRCVLVPRGPGAPLPARRDGGRFFGEPHGEPCFPARWAVAGGVAARVRGVVFRAAASSVPARPAGFEEAPGCLVVRLGGLGQALLTRAGAGLGPWAAGGAAARVLSPEARARGLRVGMSRRLAARKVPSLGWRELPENWAEELSSLRRAVEAWLGGLSAAPLRRLRGGLVLSLPGGGAAEPGPALPPAGSRGEGPLSPEGALALGEWLLAALWQRFGVRASVAWAPTAEAAAGLAAALTPGQAGAVHPQALLPWARRPAVRATWAPGRRRGAWAGPALADSAGVLGVVGALGRSLTPPARGEGLEVSLETERGRVVVPVALPRGASRDDVAARLEAALAPRLVVSPAVHGIRVAVVPPAPVAAPLRLVATHG